MASNKWVGILNHWHLSHLDQLNFQINNLSYNKMPINSQLIIVSDNISGQRFSLSSGITLVTDLRLAGFRQPFVILSFFNRQQLYKFDKFGILNDSNIYVRQLPLNIDSFNKFIVSVRRTPTESDLNSNIGLIFQRRFQALFSIFAHGKSFDLINKITGPLRAACVLSQFHPEKEFLVWELFKKVNQRLLDEISIQKLFFIIPPAFLLKVKTDIQLSLDFILLLKEFTGFKPNETDVLKLITHIDNLNKLFFQIIKKNG